MECVSEGTENITIFLQNFLAQTVPPCNQGTQLQSQAQAVAPCDQGMQHLVPPKAQAQPVPTQQPQAQAAPLPPVLPIGMHNVPLAVGKLGHPPNVQLLYGPLVPQNDEDHLLQPTIVMYNCIIQKCFTCDLKYDPNFMCAPHNMVIRSKTRRWKIINGSRI